MTVKQGDRIRFQRPGMKVLTGEVLIVKDVPADDVLGVQATTYVQVLASDAQTHTIQVHHILEVL